MTERSNRLRFLGTVLALVGWAFGLVTFLVLLAQNHFEIGGDLAAYLRAGDSLLAGEPVYVGEIGGRDVFSYAPPWAVLFGVLSWVPDVVMQAGIMVLGMLCIRYVVGSWLWSGLLFYYPVAVMVLFAGNIEYLIAASIILATRGRAEPLTLMAMAKVSPILAVPPKLWRQVLITVAVAFLCTLPWLHLWPEWFEHLLRQPSSIDIHIGPPWYVRLPFALALLLVRRPWAPALAVVVGMPSLWLGTLVILLAPIRLWYDGRRSAMG